MNENSKQKSVPKWRIVFYGLLAAAGVAGIGYFSHEPALYVFAVLPAVLISGFGFLLNSTVNPCQDQDQLDHDRRAGSKKSAVLLVFQILAIPTAALGCVLIYDLFIATPQHDTTTVVGKYVSSGRRAGFVYNLQVKGRRTYQEGVSSWFFSKCTLHDTVELSVTPIFKEWKQASLVRNGTVEAQTTPSDIYWMTFFAFGSLLPVLLLIRRLRDAFGDDSAVPFKDKIVGIYFLVVFMCELAAIGVGLKLICVLLGFSDSL